MKEKIKLKNENIKLSGASGEENKMRRSVTIQDKLNQELLTARGQIMSKLIVDIDYTTALNIFLEIGLKKYFSAQLTQDDVQVMVKHLWDTNLKKEAKLDELTETFNQEIINYMKNYIERQK